MSFFVKAVVAALKKYPIINASVEGTDIVYHDYYDIGIAVSSPRGLVVPVIRNADQLTLAGIEKQISDFANRAQEGKLTLEELSGGTFSITNGGVFGSMLSTPHNQSTSKRHSRYPCHKRPTGRGKWSNRHSADELSRAFL